MHRRQELSNSVSASPVKPVRRLPEPPSLSPALSRHTYPSEQFDDYDKGSGTVLVYPKEENSTASNATAAAEEEPPKSRFQEGGGRRI